MTQEVRSELQRLLSALCDGQMTDAQHARLEELLGADEESRRLYLEYIDLHARLLVHPRLSGGHTLPPGEAPAAAAASLPPSPARPAVQDRRRQMTQLFRYVLVATATLAASLLAQIFWWRPATPEVSRAPAPLPATAEVPAAKYVATLTQTADCAWDRPGEPWRSGSRLLPGEVRLRQGVARIRFDSGPDLVVEGPAALRLESANAATVLQGKVVFRADETAGPFDLHTPSSTLVDLGTEYAVAVGPEGEEVHVFDGEVQRTPRSAGVAETELLGTGEARRYGGAAAGPGRPTALDPARFVRQVATLAQPPADPAAGLLAYEGFDYKDADALQKGQANGGVGWAGPWRSGFARPLNDGDTNTLALNVRRSLSRRGTAAPAAGGSFEYTGFAKYFRRLATPVRLDDDGVYYLSFLIRRQGPPADTLNSVSVQLRTTEELERELRNEGVDLRKRLNFGVDRANDLFTHLQRVGTRMPLPLSYGQTYLLVAKVVASAANPDQVFLRVYGPGEPVGREEPGSWTVAGPQVQCDYVFDWLEVHINSKTRQAIDEVRLGTSWSSVTAPWAPAPGARTDPGP
jgi:ferric-dicitrate binding protein FerR (iron transport regulator)